MEVLIDNRTGEVVEMPVTKIEWKTERLGKASVLDASLIIEKPLEFPVNSGAIIRVVDEDAKIFYGFVFDVKIINGAEVAVRAYDQLRYLMYNDTFVIPASAASEAIKKIASMAKVKVGVFEDTGYVVPGIVEDDKQAFDVCVKYLDSTLIATNQNFVLFDDYGELGLKNINNMAIRADEFYIGEDSLLFDFEYKKSIDSETYNRVKLVHVDKKAGKKERYEIQDSASIAKWGQLQYFQIVNENMTPAQINDLADRIIKLRNKETKALEISCLGHWKVRAGRMVYLLIEKLGINEYFMVDECKHSWNEGVHTMSLKLKVI
ncbi:hypothetical protein P9E76_01450 [Schinkia azotoformans]|uniref:Phage protein n=1 Tax=Schinkia azotoformans LMG 9581 TaxID=1131731 RepID=K6E2U7_SCHAZ|nr:hypothetical protein [Schinkia azotoformans]EKN67501.1 phage protein [Schinkia azotoformans LMG 9581]MEC1637339.1 hypothetical protein [Schinkia azotoformans]MEC1943743.1 hypothetical protein [Schinkia azotoformans]